MGAFAKLLAICDTRASSATACTWVEGSEKKSGWGGRGLRHSIVIARTSPLSRLPLIALATDDISDLLHSQLAGSNISRSGRSGLLTRCAGFSTKRLELREMAEDGVPALGVLGVWTADSGLFVSVAADGVLRGPPAVSGKFSRQFWII